AKETLRVHVPAPVDAPAGAQVFIGKEVGLPWGSRLQLLSAGGVLERDGSRYLSNDPSLQPEPEAGASASFRAGAKLVGRAGTQAGRTCAKARQEGLPKCFLQSMLMEFTLRDDAAFFYEFGAGLYSIMSGGLGFFGYAMGIQGWALYNNAADNWVYMPVPHDWNGGFVLPVLSNQPFE